MKICLRFLIFVFFSLSLQVFALGRTEETEEKPINNEWILCVTEFNVKSMPADQLTVANVINQKIVDRLSLISYRTRISQEYYHYEGQAWSQARSTAAKNLAARQEERSALIFRGHPKWRYRQELARIDTQIEKARIAFEEVYDNPPLINPEPEFKLTAGNINGTFPAPPREGNEHRFCRDQRADAFLAGTISNFHGRFIVSLKLYVAYTRSFVWEYSTIFSTDDLVDAMEEITNELKAVLSGNKPSAIVVYAEPEDTLILVNRSFAGRGYTGVMERSPGLYVITASAPNHESLAVETELMPGELIEIDFLLKPVEYSTVEISGLSSGGSLYHGSLYIGEAPLTLRLPLNTLEFAELTTFDNRRGTIVFLTPESAQDTLSVPIRAVPIPERGRVDRERRMYYMAWGGTWVTGIGAWIIHHTFNAQSAAILHHFDPNNPDETFNEDFYNRYYKNYYIRGGLITAVAVTAVYGFYQIGRYIYAANRSTPPISRARPRPAENQ